MTRSWVSSRSIARKCGHSQKSRSSWSRISQPRLSSPSRIRACSVNCVNLCSSSLKVVLDTLVKSAAQLCEADLGNIARPADDGAYRVEATYGQSSALSEEV